MTHGFLSKLAQTGAVALAATSGAASAAELPIKTPYYKAAPYYYSWAGFYAGVNAGYAWGPSTIDVVGDPTVVGLFNVTGLATSLSTSPKGIMGGIQAGYNWQWGKVVYGVEGDLDFATIKATASTRASSGIFLPFTQRVSAEDKLDLFSTVRGRLGYTVLDSLLAYGTGGLALGHAKLSYDYSNSMGSTAGGSASKWLVGWTLGAGLEYAILRNWTVKGEYLYYDLGKAELSFPFAATATVAAPIKGNIVRLGLNYKF